MYSPGFDSARVDSWKCVDAPVPAGYNWYIAYGSNMSIEQLRIRVGEPARQTLVMIPYWSMAITKPSKTPTLGYANIFPHPDPIQIVQGTTVPRTTATTTVGHPMQKEVGNVTAAAAAMLPSATTTTTTHYRVMSNIGEGGGPPLPLPSPTSKRTSSSTCGDPLPTLPLAGAILQRVVRKPPSSFSNGGKNSNSVSSPLPLSRVASALIRPSPFENCQQQEQQKQPPCWEDTPLFLPSRELQRRGIVLPTTAIGTTDDGSPNTAPASIDEMTITSPTAARQHPMRSFTPPPPQQKRQQQQIHEVSSLPCDNEIGSIGRLPPYVICTAYLLSEDQLRVMDTFEGAPSHYRRVEVPALAFQLPMSWVMKDASGDGDQKGDDAHDDSASVASSSCTAAGHTAGAVKTSGNLSASSLSISMETTTETTTTMETTPMQSGDLPSFSQFTSLQLVERVVNEFAQNEPDCRVTRNLGSYPCSSSSGPLKEGGIEGPSGRRLLVRITGVAYIFGCVLPTPPPPPPQNNTFDNSNDNSTSSSPFVSTSMDDAAAHQNSQQHSLGLFAGLGSPTSSGTGVAVVAPQPLLDGCAVNDSDGKNDDVASVLTVLSTIDHLMTQRCYLSSSSSLPGMYGGDPMNNHFHRYHQMRRPLQPFPPNHQFERGGSSHQSSQSSSSPSLRQNSIPGTSVIAGVNVGSVLMPSSGYLGRIREGITPIKTHVRLISAANASNEEDEGVEVVRELLLRYITFLDALVPSAILSPRAKLREEGKV